MDALVSKAAMILLSLHPSPASETSAFNKTRGFQQPPRRAFALADHHLKRVVFLAAQPRNVLLYRNLLSGHDRLPRQ
jgi:hypothetical protein